MLARRKSRSIRGLSLGLRTDARRITRHLRLAQRHRSGAPLSRLPEERGWRSPRARRHYSSGKTSRVTGAGPADERPKAGTGVVRSASMGSREREFAGVLVLAAGCSTAVTRRGFADE